MNKNYSKNMKKALVVTTVASTLDQFCMNDIYILQRSYDVFVAANFKSGNNTSNERVKEFKYELQRKSIKFYDINFNRSPLSKDNLFAYKEIKKIIENNSFDIIHCHTPVAAMLVRLAARKARKDGTKVIYTAHGFHFYQGAPIKNWIIYYPIEYLLSMFTDILITINKEDFIRANKSFKAKSINYIPGVGLDIEKFSAENVDKRLKRRELKLPEEALVFLSIGELNKNKNHETVIKAIAELMNKDLYYVICGQGSLESYLKELVADLGLEQQVKLLGFRQDIAEICKVSDVFVFPSFREGLSVALMEAMAFKLPIICSKIRGNTDLIDEGDGGFIISNPADYQRFSVAIDKMINISKEQRGAMGRYNQRKVAEFSIEVVNTRLRKIYSEASKI